MYPMVQQQHDQQHDQRINRNRIVRTADQQPTVAVISRGRYQHPGALEPLQGCSTKLQESTDEEEEEEEAAKPKRSLPRRIYSYVREAWTGVKSALGNFLSSLIWLIFLKGLPSAN